MQYEPFLSFMDVEEANSYLQQLTDAGVAARLGAAPPRLPDILMGQSSESSFFVEIPVGSADVANAALDRIYTNTIALLPKDYYVYSFTDAEIQDVLANPDEWSRLDYLLAQQLAKPAM